MFQAHRATGHCRSLPARLDRAGRRPVSIAALKFTTLRRVAPAQTLPRGERGPRLATDLQPRPVPQSNPRRFRHRFRRGSCFQKQNTGISFRACPRSQNAKMPRRAFCAGAFRFSWDTLFCLHTGVSYPRARAVALTRSGSNVRNTVENIVRMKPVNIVNRYRNSQRTILARLSRLRDLYLPHRLRLIGVLLQLTLQSTQLPIDLRGEPFQALPIHTSTAPVGPYTLPGDLQVL